MSAWPAGDGSGRAALRTHAPEPAACLDALDVAAPVPRPRLDVVRTAVASVHGLAPLGGADATPDGPDDDAVMEFAVAFAADVAAIDDDLRARFLAATGDQAFATVQAIYVADMVPRVRAALDALFGAGGWDLGERSDEAGTDRADVDTWSVLEDLMRTVHQLDALDPVTTEVVRLRGARHHDCRLCRSLRSRPALLAGGDDALWEAVDDPTTLSDPVHRVAVEVVDTVVWTPARWSPDQVAAVRAAVTPGQAVELVLDVMRNAANKIAVALAADDPHVTEGVEVYEIDADGVAHYGLDPIEP
ncbi:hypothetical protein [Dermatobacter hominis]|uniref:hypothetical protein n=1 Tax=Dermatobacter hominis TaxID=2884263 RepID=UPI001D118241|nr:hypothetical protein [Dermatobacter hominis]UDY34273.1 hypothetical protein LH044_13090 [Dermatobacter hominis]